MSCRFVHFGGRPGRRPRGSSGSSTAHCASVRSARLLTAKVATRSPCRWSSSSLTHLPETSSVTAERHAGNKDRFWPLSSLLKHALARGPGGRPPIEDRAALEGILFVLNTECRWRDLPSQLGIGLRLPTLPLRYDGTQLTLRPPLT